MQKLRSINEFEHSYHQFITDSFDIAIERNISLGNYEVRPWSYISTIVDNKIKYYVKIPKATPESSNIVCDILDEANKLIAFNELADLILLDNIFSQAKLNLQVVNLVGYSLKLNAIITREYEGLALHSLSRNKKSEYSAKYYTNIGSWLNFYHEHQQVAESDKNTFFEADKEILKDLIKWLSVYCIDLYIIFNSKNVFSNILDNEQKRTYCSYTLRGFEVRNFLVSGDDSVCFLDPTEISVGSTLDDVARFIVSIDMISWGYLDAYTHKNFEEYKKIFIKSYFGSKYKEYEELLLLYILKWLLIRWKEASTRVNRFNTNTIIKYIIKKYYSDYLFKKWINFYLEKV